MAEQSRPTGTLQRRVDNARELVRQRPLLWLSVLLTSVGAAVVIWFAMNGLDAVVRVPIILVAAALNVLIASAYAADFREHDHEA
jgi:NADH:ubiquinone oxidoreductase subunit K